MKKEKTLLVQITREAAQFIGFLIATAGLVFIYSRSQYVELFNNATKIILQSAPWTETEVLLVGAVLALVGLYLLLKTR
jgi:hypothetical protein